MADVQVCEHVSAVTLGPDDRIALVVPEGEKVLDIRTWQTMLEEWWPGRWIIVEEPLRIVAMADSAELNSEAANDRG